MSNERSSLLVNRVDSDAISYTSSINQYLSSNEYDESSLVQQSNGISWYFAVFLIVNACLGAGLLNFAKAFNDAGGILISQMLQCVLVAFIFGALILLAYCTHKTKSSNFQDVIYKICGKKWQTLNSIFIILYMFGCCITFFIIIGDQLDQIFTCIFGSIENHWYLNRKFTITLSCFTLILPLCYPKRIDFLTYPSMLAVVAIIYVVILVPIKLKNLGTSDVVIRTHPDHWTDIFSVLPVICFGYQCHVNIVPIYACLKNKNLKEFSRSLIISIVIVLASYSVTAIFGLLTFGESIKDDLLTSYNSKDISILVANIMYLLKTYTSYPLNLFCARTALEGLWIEWFKMNSDDVQRNETKRRYTIVTIWFVLSLVTALLIPNISIVIHYLGALAATFMFVFPGLCLLFVTIESEADGKWSRRTILLLYALSLMYITLGVFIMGLVVTQSIYKDFL